MLFNWFHGEAGSKLPENWAPPLRGQAGGRGAALTGEGCGEASLAAGGTPEISRPGRLVRTYVDLGLAKTVIRLGETLPWPADGGLTKGGFMLAAPNGQPLMY